jgi:hypothetical protein
MVDFKGSHFAKDINLTCVRRCVTRRLSYRRMEKMMQARGGAADHAAIDRWVLKYRAEKRGRPLSHLITNAVGHWMESDRASAGIHGRVPPWR